MFSLIITIIAIALVAALAIATIYYGGAAFNKSSSTADAIKLNNQAQQILNAMTLYRVDHGTIPTQIQLLTPDSEGRTYLKSWPVALSSPLEGVSLAHAQSAAGEWQLIPGEMGVKFVSGLSQSVCQSVNNLSGGFDGILVKLSTTYSSQCYAESSGVYVAVYVQSPSFDTLVKAANGDTAKVITTEVPLDDELDPLWEVPPSTSTAYSGSLSLSGTLNFEPTQIGVPVLKDFTVTNPSLVAVGVSSVVSASPFIQITANSCLGAPLLPSQTCMVTVQFTPTTTTATTGSISVRGLQTQKVTYRIPFTSQAFVPATSNTESNLGGEGLRLSIAGNLHFGAVSEQDVINGASNSYRDFVVSNTSGSPIEFRARLVPSTATSRAAIGGSNAQKPVQVGAVPPCQSLQGGVPLWCDSSSKCVVPAGGQCGMRLQFDSLDYANEYSSLYLIAYDNKNPADVSMGVENSTVAKLPASVTLGRSPFSLRIGDSSYDAVADDGALYTYEEVQSYEYNFGPDRTFTAAVGQTQSFTINVSHLDSQYSNLASRPSSFALAYPEVNTGFSINTQQSTCLSQPLLLPGYSCTLVIDFTPTQAGTTFGALLFNSTTPVIGPHYYNTRIYWRGIATP